MNFLWTLSKFLSYKKGHPSAQRRVEQGLRSLRSHFEVEGFFCLWQNISRVLFDLSANGLKQPNFRFRKGKENL